MDRFMRKCAVDRKIVQQLLLKKSFNQITKDLEEFVQFMMKLKDLGIYLEQKCLIFPNQSLNTKMSKLEVNLHMMIY